MIQAIWQSILLLIFILFFWFIQSIIILKISKKYIYPVIYKHKFTEFVFAQASIAIHEISHFFAAIFTGSFVKESFISSRGGAVVALSSESIGGWISRIIAAFAPIFQCIFLVFLLILFNIPFEVRNVISDMKTLFKYQENFYEIFDEFVSSFYHYSKYLLVILNTVFDLKLFPISILFIYLMIIFSISAAPSEMDWRSGLEVIFSIVPFFSLLISFIFINVLFSFFGVSFFVPIAVLLIFNFLISMLGILLSIIVCNYLNLVYQNKKQAFIVIVIFFSSYILFYNLLPDVDFEKILSFFVSVLTSMISYFLFVKQVFRNNGKMKIFNSY